MADFLTGRLSWSKYWSESVLSTRDGPNHGARSGTRSELYQSNTLACDFRQTRSKFMAQSVEPEQGYGGRNFELKRAFLTKTLFTNTVRAGVYV